MLLTIDSSVYLSAFIPSGASHHTSCEFLRSIAATRIGVILPASIPLEVANTLQRNGLAPARALDLLRRFYTTDGTRIIAIDHNFSTQLCAHLKAFNMKTADAIVAGTCRHFRAQLVTWDRQLLRRTQRMLHSVTPAMWLRA